MNLTNIDYENIYLNLAEKLFSKELINEEEKIKLKNIIIQNI